MNGDMTAKEADQTATPQTYPQGFCSCKDDAEGRYGRMQAKSQNGTHKFEIRMGRSTNHNPNLANCDLPDREVLSGRCFSEFYVNPYI